MVCVYADYLQKKGCSPYVLTNFRMNNEYTLSEGVSRFVIGERLKQHKSRVLNYLERLKVIRNVCKNNNIEMAVVFGRANIVRFILATVGMKIKIVASIRISPEREFPGGISSAISKWLMGRAAGYLFQTVEQRDFFGKKIAAKSIVLPNAIEESFLRERYKGEREKNIVTVGRLAPQKNHEMLLRAFAEIADEFPDMRLIIYGEGGLRDHLEQLSDQLHIAERVRFPGEVDNISDCIWRSSIFVLASDYEGMPNALLEAMALGLPVIATDCPCGGPAEMIDNGINGLLIPVGEKDRLVEALRLLLNNKAMRDSLGEEAGNIQKRCSKERTSGELYHYLECVAKS